MTDLIPDGTNGTENVDGQAQASVDIIGEPAIDPSVSKEPNGVEGLLDGMTPEQLHKSYKELQREFGKRNEEYKGVTEKFTPYGGVQQIEKWVNYLASNPRFNEWLEGEKSRSSLGVPTEGIDEDTQKALQIVKSVAEAQINKAMKEKVEPLAEHYRERLLNENINKMDTTHGKEWRDMKDTMLDLAKTLPKENQNNPTFDDFEDLYYKALRKTGKIESYMATSYQRKLEGKKKLSTDKPQPSAGATSIGKSMSVAEAFEMAKRSLAG